MSAQFCWNLLFFVNNLIIGIAKGKFLYFNITKAEGGGVIDHALASRLRGDAFFLRRNDLYTWPLSFGGVPIETDYHRCFKSWIEAEGFPGFRCSNR
jgi:hypothetical protein